MCFQIQKTGPLGTVSLEWFLLGLSAPTPPVAHSVQVLQIIPLYPILYWTCPRSAHPFLLHDPFLLHINTCIHFVHKPAGHFCPTSSTFLAAQRSSWLPSFLSYRSLRHLSLVFPKCKDYISTLQEVHLKSSLWT